MENKSITIKADMNTVESIRAALLLEENAKHLQISDISEYVDHNIDPNVRVRSVDLIEAVITIFILHPTGHMVSTWLENWLTVNASNADITQNKYD